MYTVKLAIVTFNKNEADAISLLFDDLTESSSPTQWHDINIINSRKIRYQNELIIEHVDLFAQGNVIAATALSHLFVDAETCPHYVLFYGCAGAVDKIHSERVFIVGKVWYMSLGTVDKGQAPQQEKVTLKNKWLCHTVSRKQPPLPAIYLQPSSQYSVYNFCTGLRLPQCCIAATDKVVKVPAALHPPKRILVSKDPLYIDDEWSYSLSIAHIKNKADELPVIIDMESFGIGKIAEANRLHDRVVIFRITTDALADKDKKSNQGQLLKDGLAAVALFLSNLIQNL